MNNLWTRTDGIKDAGQVDMGCHYPLSDIPKTTGVDIVMPSTNYSPDDTCSCDVIVSNEEETLLENYPLFVILSIEDIYYFAPSFSDFDSFTQNFPEGDTTINVLSEFKWPSGAGNYSGATWYGALTNPEMTAIVRCNGNI